MKKPFARALLCLPVVAIVSGCLAAQARTAESATEVENNGSEPVDQPNSDWVGFKGDSCLSTMMENSSASK